MQIKTILCLLLCCGCYIVKSQTALPQLAAGKVIRLNQFASKFVDSRTVDIWLPPNYDSTKKYAVLYMHDGQMLFDANQTWNKQEWQIDEQMSSLIQAHKVQPTIVVGVHNTGRKRHADYFPQKAISYLPDSTRHRLVHEQLSDTPNADQYLKFLVYELKPYIDSRFATYTDKQHTFIAGSSMGGLISLYAFCEYNQIFGGAACINTHWVGSLLFKHEQVATAIYTYAQHNLMQNLSGKLYFDYGTATLDSLYPKYQQRINQLLTTRQLKYLQWTCKAFPGEAHTEQAWAKRIYLPLQYLLHP